MAMRLLTAGGSFAGGSFLGGVLFGLGGAIISGLVAFSITLWLYQKN